MEVQKILESLGLSGELSGAGTGSWLECHGDVLESVSPIDLRTIGRVRCANRDDYERVAGAAVDAFQTWRMVPAPKRGEIVRQIGDRLRSRKAELGALVTLEMGKIRAEGEGEVQEMIDIADFALGQSRMLYGLSMHSERPRHRMFEQWHPLGPVGVITTFNFPVAVWAWNAMIALVAGDTVIWKPSSKTPLTAIAVSQSVWEVLRENRIPEGLLNLLIGKHDEAGEALIRDKRIPLISATGSVAMGRHVAEVVASRMGRSLLELSGNNAVIVAPSADLDLAVRAILFAAVGTAGQRCTTTRRVIAHRSIYPALTERLIRAYEQVRIGDPLDEKTLMGPLIDRKAVKTMQEALREIETQGGRVLYGGEVLAGGVFESGTYVRPCLCEARPDMALVQRETFAPLLYLIPYDSFEEAVQWQNGVSQGSILRHLHERPAGERILPEPSGQ